MRTYPWSFTIIGVGVVSALVACSSSGPSPGGLTGQDQNTANQTGNNGTPAPAASSNSNNGNANGPAVGAGETGAKCSLAADGISFSNSGCSSAMQAGCCNETQACFYNNKDCVALHTCVLKCPVPGSGGGGGGGTADGGGGGGGGGGGTDAGTNNNGMGASAKACKDACYAHYPNEATTEEAYNACYAAKGVTACK